MGKLEKISMSDWADDEPVAAPVAAAAAPEAPVADIKLFNKWNCNDVVVNDLSLKDYIAVMPKFLPHSAGRYASKRFRKAQCPIVERLVNSLMMHGRNNGKKLLTVRIVKHCFEIIHLLTGNNPVQILVDAIINSGAREDSFRNIKSIAECLADELINAAKGSSNSYAIKKKDELERVAKSNRENARLTRSARRVLCFRIS